MKRSVDFLKKAVTLTQVLIAVATPLFLCVVGGLWLCKKLELGRGFMALFILLGVGSSLRSLWKWLQPLLREDEKKPPASFNDHF